MEKRQFGRSNHPSTLAIFGGAAFWDVNQEEANRTMNLVLESGINHIDVAPQYGKAEERLGPWLEDKRNLFFLGCKTLERTKEKAAAELQHSLKLLHTDQLDLYQAHAVNSFEELDQITAPGGALEAFIEAREKSLTRHIGLTSHGMLSPEILIEALRRFDFDSVLFPVNYMLYAREEYHQKANELLELCEKKDVGVMAIKAIGKGPWNEDEEKTFNTWYKPFSTQESIQEAVNFTLSQKVTGICMAGDTTLIPMIIKACENFSPLSKEEEAQLIRRGQKLENFFT